MKPKWFKINENFWIDLLKVQPEMVYKDVAGPDPEQHMVILTNTWKQPIYETPQQFFDRLKNV